MAIDMARRNPDKYGVRVMDKDGRIQLQLGDEPPIRPLMEPLYTLGSYLAFMRSRGITGALVGPLMDVVGYPFEITLAACSLIFGGTLDRMPGLTVVLVHGGGFFPYQVERFDRGHRVRPEPGSCGAGPASRYLRRFYYDTLTHSRASLQFLCHVVGADRLLLGSDYPFPLGDPEPVRTVRDSGLGESEEGAALGDNALRIFRMKP